MILWESIGKKDTHQEGVRGREGICLVGLSFFFFKKKKLAAQYRVHKKAMFRHSPFTNYGMHECGYALQVKDVAT